MEKPRIDCRKFRGEARLSTWIYRICINVALGRIRTKRRRPAAVAVMDLEATAAAQSPGAQLQAPPETPGAAPPVIRDHEPDRNWVSRPVDEASPSVMLHASEQILR